MSEDSTPSPEDVKRAIELSNRFVIASRVPDIERPGYHLRKEDCLLISAALRTFALTWGTVAQRHEIAEFLAGSPEDKARRHKVMDDLAEISAVQGYHLVNTDNFGGDYPDERFLAGWKEGAAQTGLANLEWTDDPAKAQTWADDPYSIAERINKQLGEHASRYIKVVKKGYKLQPGFEP